MGDQMGNIEYNGIENRKHMRTTYPAAKRPIFRARGQKLEIKDISRGGLKFSHPDEIIINGWVKGFLDFTDGTRIEVEGIVVRIENESMGLSFIGDLEDDVYRQINTTRGVDGNSYC
ncbi:MAG: PilZ domain-containing protein [Bacteroidetes bacterium]|nr:PilZ domain-containing protein [Bacteroidota bacterium]